MPTWDDVMIPPEPMVARGFTQTTVRLGADTYNTCNPGIGDADGDGLDEIAVPLVENGRCRIALYKGDGSEIWRNDQVAFYNVYYQDPDAHRGTHWHVESRHRHLFTGLFDIDGDGAPEVVCGDGPLWVLDARTGRLKQKIDLEAHVQTWCTARLDGPDAPPSIVAGIERRDGTGSAVVVIGKSLGVDRLVPVEGRSFEDAIWAGDLDRDGCDEIVFSPASTQSMFLMDRDGRIRWSQLINGVLGDDTHVDDLIIDSVLPGDERQILMATGPALLDKDGQILWTLGERYHHAQRVLAVPRPGGGRNVYFCESMKRNAYLLDPAGAELWRFDGFQKPTPDYRDKVTPRLTTAGCLADWFGSGDPVIVQAEVVCARRNVPDPLDGVGTFYAVLLTLGGEVITYLPFEDALDGWGGAMCARRGRFNSPQADGLVVICHSSSRMYFFSAA